MFKSYLQVLRKKNFRHLWCGQVISQFGDRLTQMALIGLVYEIKDAPSTFGLAKIMTLSVIPVFLISPVAGVYVDRWNKQKTMFWSDVLRGFCIVLILPAFYYLDSLIAVYIFIFFSFCIGRFFIPAKMSIVPLLVDEDQIFLANSLVSTTAMIAAVLGLGLGGLIVERYGVKAAFVLDALTFFVSGYFIAGMVTKEQKYFRAKDIVSFSKDAIGFVKRSVIKEVHEGVRYLFQSKETRYAAKVFFTLFSLIGALYVVFVVFIQETFSSITKDLGILAIGGGLGLFVGTLLYGRVAHKFDVKRVINSTLLSASIYMILFVVVVHQFPLKLFAAFSCFLLGCVISPVAVAVNSLIHQDSDTGLWGRIFSSLEIIIHLAFIIFMFVSSYLAERVFSPFTIIVSVGIIFSLFSLTNLLLER